jgi:hypothetical protein
MTDNTKTGGPAFPAIWHDEHGTMWEAEGMTLRDYFAAKAMQGLLSNHTAEGQNQEYASWAYQYADAMLKAREA